MTHWVREPIVVRTRDDRPIVSLAGSGWDGSPTFPRRDQVELHLRRYPEGALRLAVAIDVEREVWWFPGEPEATQRTATLVDELERAFERHVEKAAPDYLSQGFCPYCKSKLFSNKGLLRRRRPSSVRCQVCEREWQLPE